MVNRSRGLNFARLMCAHLRISASGRFVCGSPTLCNPYCALVLQSRCRDWTVGFRCCGSHDGLALRRMEFLRFEPALLQRKVDGIDAAAVYGIGAIAAYC